MVSLLHFQHSFFTKVECSESQAKKYFCLRQPFHFISTSIVIYIFIIIVTYKQIKIKPFYVTRNTKKIYNPNCKLDSVINTEILYLLQFYVCFNRKRKNKGICILYYTKQQINFNYVTCNPNFFFCNLSSFL